MQCTRCSAQIESGARFCPACGAEQKGAISETRPMSSQAAGTGAGTSATNPSPPGAVGSPSHTMRYGAIAAAALLLAGGAGYWSWQNQKAAEEAARKLSEMERTAAQLQQQNAQAAARANTAAVEASKAAEEAERLAVALAQAALDQHIAKEEDEARSQVASATKR